MAGDLQSRLKELVRTHTVPGASLAILTDDGIENAVAGVVNRNTKVTTTVDSGPGDDAVEQYVDSLEKIGLAHPPGALWSYSNAAFCVAGRIVEVLRSKSYDQALHDHLFGPAGLTEHITFPQEAVLRRAAV